jgi:hypothetical protein
VEEMVISAVDEIRLAMLQADAAHKPRSSPQQEHKPELSVNLALESDSGSNASGVTGELRDSDP